MTGGSNGGSHLLEAHDELVFLRDDGHGKRKSRRIERVVDDGAHRTARSCSKKRERVAPLTFHGAQSAPRLIPLARKHDYVAVTCGTSVPGLLPGLIRSRSRRTLEPVGQRHCRGSSRCAAWQKDQCSTTCCFSNIQHPRCGCRPALRTSASGVSTPPRDGHAPVRSPLRIEPDVRDRSGMSEQPPL